ncbi:MAG: energy-coupling factor transporter transmembrane protein EcfT [Clostridiaceae bacterium]|jgi:energy-coupling factor transport system permease protein|nr:energy-coupling factor transporter transmembrane protein EcfT [Clostridiaceae bacterium]
MGKSMLGRSIPGNSFLHQRDARVKFIAAILMMVATLSIRDVRVMALFVVWTACMMAVSRIRPSIILRSVRPIVVIILFAVILHLVTVEGKVLFQIGSVKVTEEGLFSGLMTALRLSLMIINTSLLLTLTTPPLAIADALESLLSPLRLVRFPVHEFAMMMSIALRFVPTLMDEAVKIMKAQSSRGANYDTGGLLKRASGLVSILVPLFVSSFRRADDLAVAMDARCYQGEKGRTRIYASKLEASDLLFLVLIAALLVFALISRQLLPALSGLMGSTLNVF